MIDRIADRPELVVHRAHLRRVQSKRRKSAHDFLVRGTEPLVHFLLRRDNRLDGCINDPGRFLHPLKIFRAHAIDLCICYQLVRPVPGAQRCVQQFAPHVQRFLRRLFQAVRDLSDPVYNAVKADVRPDPLKRLVHVAYAALGFFSGFPDVLQFSLHIHQVSRCLVYLLLHLLEFCRRLRYTVPLHGFQGAVCLFYDVLLFFNLLCQQCRLVLQRQFLVAGQLQLGLVQFQLLVKIFDGGLAFLHALFKLSYPRNAHLDADAARHCFTPL